MQTGQQNANIASGLGSAATSGILTYEEMQNKALERNRDRMDDKYRYSPSDYSKLYPKGGS